MQNRVKQSKVISNALAHSNNFDFLRVVAAFMVLYSHQYPLLGHDSPSMMTLANHWELTLGSLGVAIFFIISGYLVTQSWIREPRALRYLVKRFLRVWPGLATATLLAVFIIGPLTSNLTLHDYFHDPRTWHYLKILYGKIVFHLPGVFEDNPFPDAVNGSLWTIRIELKWYLYLLILGMITSLMKPEWRRAVFLVFLVVLVFYYFIFHHAQTRSERSWTMDYGMYFCSGALMLLCRDQWRNIYWLFAMLAGAVAFYFDQTIMAVLFMLVTTVVVFGKSAIPVLKDFSRFGDFSYGIYIYAFMLQQTLAWRFGNELSFMTHLALVTIMSLVCAFFSWHLIEKPALKLKKRLGV